MNEAIIILGMHRSGTSCLTGCLNNHGLNLGNISDSNKHNKKGNQENKAVFKLNEALLNYNQGSWRRPPTKLLTWNDELEIRCKNVISTYNKIPTPWGIKDPRMLMTYKFWEKQLPDHKIVGTIRHPVAVVKSLLARKHKNLIMSEEQAYHLWQIYNEKLIELYNNSNFSIVNFDLEHSIYLQKIGLISNNLKLKTEKENKFFEKSLINQSNYTRNDCPQDLLQLYDQLLDICI